MMNHRNGLAADRNLRMGLALAFLVSGVGMTCGEDRQTSDSTSVLSRAVNSELTDVAGALRQLDQSYAYRGMQGRGSATAGSVYIDWEAKGIPQEQRVRVLPPQPLVLSQSSKQPCQSCPTEPVAETQPNPAPKADCPCQQREATVVPGQSSPCPNCGAAVTFAPVIPCPACAVSAGAATPAEVFYHGQRVSGGCGGRIPPNAMLVNGRWMEYPAAGCGRNGYQPLAPGVHVAPTVYGVPVW